MKSVPLPNDYVERVIVEIVVAFFIAISFS
jgi:hypothetical protein